MIVADANVVLRAFRSRNGASHAILQRMLRGDIEFAASPAIIFEYEAVLTRDGALGNHPVFSRAEIEIVLDAICARALTVQPWFRFRPFLADPKDDLYIECALAARVGLIVTDDRHFRHPAVAAFGLKVLSAAQYVAQYPKQRKPA